MIKPKHLLAKWTNKDPSTSLSCTKGINNEVLSFKMWNNNTVVTRNDNYASRFGKCRHSQNEPKLKSNNITEPIIYKPWIFGRYNFQKKNHLSFKCGTIIRWLLRVTHRLQDPGKCRHLQNEPKLIRSHNVTEPYVWTIHVKQEFLTVKISKGKSFVIWNVAE